MFSFHSQNATEQTATINHLNYLGNVCVLKRRKISLLFRLKLQIFADLEKLFADLKKFKL